MLDILRAYKPDENEVQYLKDIRSLIETGGDACYYRDHFNPGHMTGSGLLISADGQRVLMNHHAIMDIWFGFGGHADGEQDMAKVALREVIEESGIEDIEFLHDGIFDVDVHDIPPNLKKNEPAHKHFDIRYLFRVRKAANENFVISPESNNMRWCTFEQAHRLASPADHSIHRLLDKWRFNL
ncbi:MAG: NUDIX hydrolase [Micavibrio aeruginosavorus]|uniref:NUDIX hydrolase n=1 Tax=Micavibrio aeruginosavorus TaxID=349221 RepID=A0A2W5PF76_9BACT|nr:MAG: NUDIX hydrolase [Micavibrio aeruginosavorus]